MEPADLARLRRYRLAKGVEATGFLLALLAVPSIIALMAVFWPAGSAIWLLLAAVWAFFGWTTRHAPRACWRAKADLQVGAGLVVSGVVAYDRRGWRIGGETVAVLPGDESQLTPGDQVEARCGLATRLVLEAEPL